MQPTQGSLALPYMQAPFRPHAEPTLAQAHYVPLGFSARDAPGTLDLAKVVTYFSAQGRGPYAHKTLREIRNSFANGAWWPRVILEEAVTAIFVEYCRHLQTVPYVSNVSASPFERLFNGTGSNCYGRATGFLQLLTIAGFSKDTLSRYTLPLTDGFKICAKPPARLGQALTSYSQHVGATPTPAPNAIQLRFVNGALQVDRVFREPFASHDAMIIDVRGVGPTCWDPLLMMSYDQFSDCFDIYQEATDPALFSAGPWLQLRQRGLQCYISNEAGRNGDRIYHLPPRAALTGTLTFPHFRRNVRHQPLFTQAYNDLSARDNTQRMAVIFDQEDWNHQANAHPPILLEMFRFLA